MSDRGRSAPRSVSFDRIADRYDDTRGGEARGARTAAVLRPWLLDGPVLEVGVGTGLVAAAVAAERPGVLGVDLSLPMIRRAQPRLAGRVAAGDALRLPVRTAAVRTAYLVHVLHLVASIEPALAELRRVLAPAGRLLVVCSGTPAAVTDVDVLVHDLYRRLRGPRPDDPDRIIDLAQRAGFALEHRRGLATEGSMSPAAYASTVEERVWAWTWDVDEQTWADVALPAVELLRSLPDPDTPRAVEEIRTLLVLGRP